MRFRVNRNVTSMSQRVRANARPTIAHLAGAERCDGQVIILHCSKNLKTAPAKGAMAFQFASLYWCRWQSWGSANARLAPITLEETCVN